MKHWQKGLYFLFIGTIIIFIVSAFDSQRINFINQLFLPLVMRDKSPSTSTPTSTQTLVPSVTPTLTPTLMPTAIPTATQNCHYSYPTVCIPPPPPDLDCGDIPYKNFTVLPPDPHNFDGDGDGIGCESWVKIELIETGGDGADYYWEEFVQVENNSDTAAKLTGWTIWSKRNNKTYTFPSFELKSNQTVKMWTRPGTDTDMDLFWGLSNEVWKNDGDCARLSDDYGYTLQWYIYPGDECVW